MTSDRKVVSRPGAACRLWQLLGSSMKRAIVWIAGLTISFASIATSAEEPGVWFLRFPAADLRARGVIDKVLVTVDCGSISGLRNLPALYDVSLSYDIPTQHIFEAVPRLGSAAVMLTEWNDVIGVRLPADADAQSCFKVDVVAESSQTGVARHWVGGVSRTLSAVDRKIAASSVMLQVGDPKGLLWVDRVTIAPSAARRHAAICCHWRRAAFR